ncbi:MAG: tetratricopeptide repeat protein [Planctomycetes bacterium]|nr:tetratricopeptide repeat protein [Planctomycetota bacterium]
MLGTERVLRELHEALEGHEFSSKEELDAFIAALNRRSMKPSPKTKASRSRKHQAQDLAYQAMETHDPIQAVRLCERAIRLDPHCVDALVHLTRLSCDDRDEIIEHIKRVVDIGERDLGGADYFSVNAGHFWGLLETRPYMRAKAYLAQLLVEAGKPDEAIDHYEELLRFNPNDNQGLRYPLMGLYLLADNLEGVRRLFREFEDEGSAVFAWSRVLERHLSGDEGGAAKALRAARQCNKHVEKYLTGRKAMSRELPPYYGFGDENEAIVCAASIGKAWRQHPQSVDWLKRAR